MRGFLRTFQNSFLPVVHQVALSSHTCRANKKATFTIVHKKTWGQAPVGLKMQPASRADSWLYIASAAGLSSKYQGKVLVPQLKQREGTIQGCCGYPRLLAQPSRTVRREGSIRAVSKGEYLRLSLLLFVHGCLKYQEHD